MGVVKGGRRKRPYQSPLREESARRTRQAVVQAAASLFVERGYAGTSLADVAQVAGVARPTVFAAFGSKAALLKQVLDESLAGDDEPVPVGDRPWFRPVWEAPDPGTVLDAYATVCSLISARAARIIEVVRRAADETDEATELWRTLQHTRRIGAGAVVERAASLGPLRHDIQRATDIMWIYNDTALYSALVLTRDWPEPDYTAWLAASMRAALLP